MGDTTQSDKLLLSLSIILIALTAIGVHRVNTANDALLLSVAVVGLAVAPVAYVHANPVSDRVAFVGALLTTLALSIITPLRGRIIARDAPIELYSLHSIQDGTWPILPLDPISPLLFNPLLAIGREVLGIDHILLYRGVAALLPILVVATTFIFFNHYFRSPIPFLLTVFIAFQHAMLTAAFGSIRVTLAMLCFVVLLYLFAYSTQHTIRSTRVRTLMIIILTALIGHYYSAALFLIAFLVLIVGAQAIQTRWQNGGSATSCVSPELILISIVIMGVWLVYGGGLEHVVIHLQRMIISLDEFLVLGQPGGRTEDTGTGTTLLLADLYIYGVVGATLGLMALGAFRLMRGRTLTAHQVQTFPLAIVAAALALSGVAIGTPIFADQSIGIMRIYQFTVFVLAACLPVACSWIRQLVEGLGISGRITVGSTLLLAVIVAAQLTAFSGLAYQLHDKNAGPDPIWFDNDGEQAALWIVEEVEIAQTEFLTTYGADEYVIYGDRYMNHRVLPFLTRDGPETNLLFFYDVDRHNGDGYVYLRAQNIRQAEVRPFGAAYMDAEPLDEQESLDRTAAIYTSGDTEVRLYRHVD